MALKIYTYKACSTCRNAIAWLKQHGIEFEEHPIRETPPTEAELASMLKARGSLGALFNTSGQDYRAMGIKDRLATLTPKEAFALMRETGNLVKRPFAIDDRNGVHLTGFKEDEWAKVLKR